MTSLSSFIKDPRNTYYDGQDDNEHVLYVLRRSHLTNAGWAALILVMLIAPAFFIPLLLSAQFGGQALLTPIYIFVLSLSWYLAVFGIFLFNAFNWFFNVYIISDKKIVDFDFYGLTYKNIADAPITNIQDVTAKISGPINMVFNIGDVYVQTAAENREFDFGQIDDPGRVRDIISDMAAEVKHTNV